MSFKLFYVATLLTIPLGCNSSPSLIDLSYTFNKTTPNHPQLSKFNLRLVKKGLNRFNNWVELNDFFSSEHSGTHIDAPAHYAREGLTVDEIPNWRLYRVPGVKIDVREKIRDNINYEIRSRDIIEWTEIYGKIPDGAVVLFQTGWGSIAMRPGAYSGMDQFGNLNFPGIGRDAAELLTRYGNLTGQRQGIVGVGIDTLSIDVGQSTRVPAHVILLGSGIYALENVANLEKLPSRGFTVTALPIKIGGGSGGPVRIIAEIEGEPYASPLTSSSISIEQPSAIFVKCFIFILIFRSFWRAF